MKDIQMCKNKDTWIFCVCFAIQIIAGFLIYKTGGNVDDMLLILGGAPIIIGYLFAFLSPKKSFVWSTFLTVFNLIVFGIGIYWFKHHS